MGTTGYKYETHCHTAEGSGCSEVSGAEIVKFYLEKGYSGIVITDHFTGKTTVPPHYKWKDRVNHFFTGYEAAKSAAAGTGLEVFFSLEYSERGNDFLFYGIGKEFLLENPDLRDIGLTPLLKRVREAGAFIIHAHPFASESWIPEIRIVPNHIDAVEVCNGGNGSVPAADLDRRANWYADEYGLKKTGGTDTHYFNNIRLTGVTVPQKAKTIAELAAQIKAGKSQVISPISL